MFGTPYTGKQLITAVLASATAFVLASTVIGAGLGLAAGAMGIGGATVGTGIQIFSFAAGMLGSMAGFQGGLKLHDKIEDINFSRKNKRLHTANRPAMNSQKKTFGQKLSNIFKRSKTPKVPKGTIVLGQSPDKKKNNTPKR